MPEPGDSRLAAARRDDPAAPERRRRLHVVGCQRSGTTLVAELLASCFENDGHAEHEQSIFRPPPIAAGLYVSKKPSDIRRIEPLLAADPDLFVVNVERDPRAVITSRLRGRYLKNYDEWARCRHAAARLADHPRFTTVRYDRLVTAPGDVQAQLEQRFPFLVRKHAFTEFVHHARPSERALNTLGGLRPLSDDRTEGWREHLPRLSAEYIRHPEMAAALIEMGLEPNDAWTAALAGVEPYEQPRRSALRQFFKDLDEGVRVRLQQRRYLARLAPARR